MKVGFGIVGCGMIANFHAKAIERIKGARIAACTDNIPASAERFAAANGCTAYGSIKDMLADPAVDIVTICTPSGSHKEPAVEAARAGKHVIVEKPLEITLARCDAIIDACRKNKVLLATIFPSRFSDANIAAQGGHLAGPLRHVDAGGRLRQMVADPAVLRQRRLARDLGPRRRRRLHEPGDP